MILPSAAVILPSKSVFAVPNLPSASAIAASFALVILSSKSVLASVILPSAAVILPSKSVFAVANLPSASAIASVLAFSIFGSNSVFNAATFSSAFVPASVTAASLAPSILPSTLPKSSVFFATFGFNSLMAASFAFDFSVLAWILPSRSVLACPPAVDPVSKACTLLSKVVTFGVSALIAVSLDSDFCLFAATCASLVLSTVF